MSADCHAPAPPPPTVEGAPDEPDAALPRVLLTGRPNAGKSSLYNRLTGGDAHVGNFPGITVDLLEATVDLPGAGRVRVLDLPGVYSLEAATDPDTDEGIARSFLDRAASEPRPYLVLQVVDATRLSLGLRLTAELLRRGAPLLVVLSQRDVLQAEGRALDAEALARALGVPVVAVDARRAAARAEVLAAIDARLTAGTRAAPPAGRLGWDPDALAASVVHDRHDADADARRRRERTERADAVLLHPVAGPLAFVAIMTAIFAAVFLVADPVTAALDVGVGALGGAITRALGPGLAASFLADGLLGGAGTVLAFLPQIVVLTLAMELLEATGYLARGAFLVDRLLRAAGLGGRAFIPLLTAHACAVPAIQATRILRDPRERLTTILVLPLMACSARIPVYSLIITTFFAAWSPWGKALLFVGLYFAGIALGLAAATVLRRAVTRGRPLPLVLELPAYHLPEAGAVARQCWRAGGRFLRDVGTTILAASAVLWALLSVPLPAGLAPAVAPGTPPRVAALERSVAAGVGRALEPVTRPLGFDWRINVGLIGSFGARELMVGTMGVIFGIEDAGDDDAPLAAKIRDARRPDGAAVYTPRAGLALMAFFVIACQCMSTVAAIRRETRSWRYALIVLGYTYALAYAAALLVYQGARLLGVG